MADKRIVEYLKLGRKKGVLFDILKKKLLEKGHSAKNIEDAAKEAGIKNLQYKPLVIVSIVVLLVLFFFIIQNLGKKTDVGVELTSKEQLSIINKALSEKYSNYNIKNFGEVAYDEEPVLRAEVDLGYIDVCGQRIRADSAVFVVKDGKIIETPAIEIRNKFTKLGDIVFDAKNETKADIKKIDGKILYNCRNATCSYCQLNDAYEVMVKLKSPYIKRIDSNSISGAGVMKLPSTYQAPASSIVKLQPASPSDASKSMTLMPLGDTKITHKFFVSDENGNLIYSSEAYESDRRIRLLKGEFS
ncbi:MAG: hypothetical protein AABX33_06575 [Nanoarchaeota archaeon]